MRSNELELRALMLAGLDNDAAAHTTLLEKLGGHLRGYFKSRLVRVGRGSADAEDLVQETLLVLHTRRHTYDRSQLLTPWVQAIARYKLVDYLRQTRASLRDVSVEEADDVWAAESVAVVDSTLDLEQFLAQISPKLRRIIRLVKLNGLSLNETAAVTGMSVSAVKVSVHRGLRALSHLTNTRNRL